MQNRRTFAKLSIVLLHFPKPNKNDLPSFYFATTDQIEGPTPGWYMTAIPTFGHLSATLP